METLFVPLALFAGALLAVQAGANAQLSKATGSPFGATTLQLGVGALVLLAAAALSGTLLAATRLPDVPWWHAGGGLASAFYVVSTILLFPRLGAVVSVGLFIAGQMLASLALDTLGVLGVNAAPLTLPTVLGALLIIGSAALIVFSQKNAAGVSGAARRPWIVLALLAGAVLPVQGAVNALLRTDLGAPFAASLISFVVATLAMAAVLLVATTLLHAPRPHAAPLRGMPWWGWLGGVAGAVYVTTTFTALPVIGAAAAVGLTVAGQQVAAVFFDRYGLMRLPRRPVSSVRLAGVVGLLLGVLVLQVF